MANVGHLQQRHTATRGGFISRRRAALLLIDASLSRFAVAASVLALPVRSALAATAGVGPAKHIAHRLAR